MKLANKIKWIAGTLLIFLIILTTNLIDKENFDRLRYSVVTIYEDRVVANDLIFEILLRVQNKELAVAKADTDFFQHRNQQVNLEIENLIAQYEQTKLTVAEQKLFTSLKDDLAALKSQELIYVNAGLPEKLANSLSFDKVIDNLTALSKVQLIEGKKQMSLSNSAMEAINLFTRVEIVFLILIAILVQAIIFYTPSETSEEKFANEDSFNHQKSF